MIYIGDNELLGVKLGNDDITGIYVGDNLIYPTTVTAWTVEPSSFSIPFDGEIAKIKLAALTPWTATTDANWITLSESTGDGGRYRINMTVSPNISTARTANVVITGEDNYTETISVSQAAIPFSASVDSISTYSEGGSFSFDIMCPHSWSLVVSGDSTNWLTVSPLTGSNGTVQVGVVISQLEGDEDRNADLVITDDVTGDELIISVNQSPIPPYEEQYLTFEILSDGVIRWEKNLVGGSKTIQYKKNDGEWTSITSANNPPTISVVNGDIVEFRGDNAFYGNGNNYNRFGGTCRFNAYGNIMSLVNSTDYQNITAMTISNREVFKNIFNSCTGLTSAENLKLPVVILEAYCYENMFYNCTGLITAPELPATTLTTECYRSMFEGCTGLTQAPSILPATTLAQGCYRRMFQNCTSLTGGPTTIGNSATTLADYCCHNMFAGCTSLTQAPELPATTLAFYCYYYMFQNCTGLTQAPSILPATTLVTSCYCRMFENCTSLTTAPELPATRLVQSCYEYMFVSCSNLNYIKCLATNISELNSHVNWVSGVQTTSGTFVKAAGITESTWGRGTSGIPTNWTVEDAS